MRPTIGRIVHFKAAGDCGGDIYPAIVTKVHDDGTIDVTTFGSQSLYWHQKVAELTPDKNLERAGWFWPPREGAPS